MKAWAISDTHNYHLSLSLPQEPVDTVIYAGDSTNYYDILRNQPEFDDFITWFNGLSIKNKILIPGNHDAWAMKKYNIEKVKDLGIHYLDHEYLELDGKLFFGSPYTPTFGLWHFMKDRSKLSQYWEALTDNIDVLITHGPPKGILDLSHDRQYNLEYCGDGVLTKAVFKMKPKYHIFGHIHDSDGCFNSGVIKISNYPTTFMNVSCITDGKFDRGCSSHGQIITI